MGSGFRKSEHRLLLIVNCLYVLLRSLKSIVDTNHVHILLLDDLSRAQGENYDLKQ